uniref:U-box domain-containing protein n=1 Tax=Vitrella brassicaformis TaxID=1169539 RepID=A0A7S1P9L6_9ALVE
MSQCLARVDPGVSKFLAEVPDEEFPEDIWRCPITLQPLRRPVVTPSGNTYEYSPMKKLIKSNPQQTAMSPQPRQPLHLDDLRPNRYAVNQIEQRAKQLLKEQQMAVDEGEGAATSSRASRHDQILRSGQKSRSFLRDYWRGYRDTVLEVGVDFEPTRAILDFLERESELTFQLLSWHKKETTKHKAKQFKTYQDFLPRQAEKTIVAWLNFQETTLNDGLIRSAAAAVAESVEPNIQAFGMLDDGPKHRVLAIVSQRMGSGQLLTFGLTFGDVAVALMDQAEDDVHLAFARAVLHAMQTDMNLGIQMLESATRPFDLKRALEVVLPVAEQLACEGDDVRAARVIRDAAVTLNNHLNRHAFLQGVKLHHCLENGAFTRLRELMPGAFEDPNASSAAAVAAAVAAECPYQINRGTAAGKKRSLTGFDYALVLDGITAIFKRLFQ